MLLLFRDRATRNFALMWAVLSGFIYPDTITADLRCGSGKRQVIAGEEQHQAVHRIRMQHHRACLFLRLQTPCRLSQTPRCMHEFIGYRLMSHVTRTKSHVTRHTYQVIRHTSHVTRCCSGYCRNARGCSDRRNRIAKWRCSVQGDV